jgi:peptide/bleomycin uptake transporter
MFHEFFLRGSRARIAWAWFGLASIMGKAVFSAWNKRRYNDFTLDFYNLVAYGQEYGLGHEQMVDRLYSIMWSWLSIQMAQFLVYPALRILHNYWAASWRFVLVEEYLQRWHRNSRPLEGVSQRIHEDAHRFTEGINWITYDLLDSIASLVAFTPLLATLGEKVPPPGFGKGEVPGVWLAYAAVGGGIVGTGISLFIGRHLVAIRVSIQRLNAKLRRDLVLVESAYEHVAGADPDEYSTKHSRRASRLAPFAPLLTEMWNAYSTMYVDLGALA